MNVQSYAIMFFLMVFAIYIGGMWTHRSVEAYNKQKEYEKWLEAQAAATTTV